MTTPNPIVITDQDHVFTTSLLVAEKFEKNISTFCVALSESSTIALTNVLTNPILDWLATLTAKVKAARCIT
jgi:hypothetical protein